MIVSFMENFQFFSVLPRVILHQTMSLIFVCAEKSFLVHNSFQYIFGSRKRVVTSIFFSKLTFSHSLVYFLCIHILQKSQLMYLQTLGKNIYHMDVTVNHVCSQCKRIVS